MAAYYVPVEKYSVLREFHDQVRFGDEQRAILKSLESPGKQ